MEEASRESRQSGGTENANLSLDDVVVPSRLLLSASRTEVEVAAGSSRS